jgi:SAM-dependent methyltransferase
VGHGETCTLGEIMLTAGVVANGLPARGRLLPINQDQALFALLGTTDGRDGITNFQTPDLRGAGPRARLRWSTSAMDFPDREQLRTTFEEVPELYDRVRPTYPPALFGELVELAGIPERGRILEIGTGPGKATVPLAECGFEILGIELGERLAALARRNLAGFANVEIVNADFETWEPAAAGFDAVVSFTAFHWIDPATRYVKTARTLREGGALAVVETSHVLPEGGDPFWVEVQEDYDAVFPGENNEPTRLPDEVEGLAAEIEASGLYAPPVVRRYVWDVTYSPEDYVGVLETYSGHRAADLELRERLYERIRRRIDALPGGEVRKSYLALLSVARRL